MYVEFVRIIWMVLGVMESNNKIEIFQKLKDKLQQNKEPTMEQRISYILEEYVNPSVAMHGGSVSFNEYDDTNSILYLNMNGACSGCSMSTHTLQMGVTQLIQHYIPEIKMVEGIDDPDSTVDPYFSSEPNMLW